MWKDGEYNTELPRSERLCRQRRGNARTARFLRWDPGGRHATAVSGRVPQDAPDAAEQSLKTVWVTVLALILRGTRIPQKRPPASLCHLPELWKAKPLQGRRPHERF